MTYLSPESILKIYSNRGQDHYSTSSVSYLAHAWQCGQLAFYAEASHALQLACWLHDLGHLIAGQTQIGRPCDNWHRIRPANSS